MTSENEAPDTDEDREAEETANTGELTDDEVEEDQPEPEEDHDTDDEGSDTEDDPDEALDEDQGDVILADDSEGEG